MPTGTTATIWDMYDSFSGQKKPPENNDADSRDCAVSSGKGQERRGGSGSGSGSGSGDGGNKPRGLIFSH